MAVAGGGDAVPGSHLRLHAVLRHSGNPERHRCCCFTLCLRTCPLLKPGRGVQLSLDEQVDRLRRRVDGPPQPRWVARDARDTALLREALSVVEFGAVMQPVRTRLPVQHPRVCPCAQPAPIRPAPGSCVFVCPGAKTQPRPQVMHAGHALRKDAYSMI